ncbi:TetR family transcriptional regulator [Rhodococcus sp. WS4]|nr:TetR family transcriptional regulator [Rhodococcus sp. WS4]
MVRKGIANDPSRKARISKAALDIVAESGLRAATHRRIADRAGVPLGSVTYHFADIDEILASAFETLGEQIAPRYNDAIAAAPNQYAARRVLVDAVCGSSRATEWELRLIREMYAYGSVSHRVRNLIRAFEESSLRALQTHFPEPAARALDALVEGWWIYQSWAPEALDEDMVRDAIDAIADKFGPCHQRG